jgi:carboxylesterase
VNSIPNAAGFTLSGGKIGVLVLHGFTSTPIAIKPWANFFNQQGFTVSAPLLPGHGSNWQELNEMSWQDWYAAVETAFSELKSKCERVFIAGFSMGGTLALRLCQIHGNQIEGLMLLNTPIHDRRWFIKLIPLAKFLIPSIKKRPTDVAAPNPPKHAYGRTPLKAFDSLRQLWRVVERDLYLIDLPIMVAYSTNDHAVDPVNSQTIVDNIFSVDIREVVFENSYHNVCIDFDSQQLNIESKLFIEDVLAGKLKRGSDFNESDIVDAQFDSIISGLSLDQSAPTTYLDELSRIEESERFIPPNPKKIDLDQMQRIAAALFVGSSFYLVLFGFTDFEFFGPWPSILGYLTCVATIIWRTARSDDDFEDGASL